MNSKRFEVRVEAGLYEARVRIAPETMLAQRGDRLEYVLDELRPYIGAMLVAFEKEYDNE